VAHFIAGGPQWQEADLLGHVEELELAESYDFAYDIDRPTRINGRTEEVV